MEVVCLAAPEGAAPPAEVGGFHRVLAALGLGRAKARAYLFRDGTGGIRIGDGASTGSLRHHLNDTGILRRPSGTQCEFCYPFPALRAGLKSSASLWDFWGIYDPTRLFGNLRRPSGTQSEFAAPFPALRAGLNSPASLRDFNPQP